MKIATLFVDERTATAHQRRDCVGAGLVKYVEYGDDVFRWLYVPARPGHNARLLTTWQECRRCFA